jgi:hypothetical protein
VPTRLHAGEGQLDNVLNMLAGHGARWVMRSTARRMEPCGMARQGGQRSERVEFNGAR